MDVRYILGRDVSFFYFVTFVAPVSTLLAGGRSGFLKTPLLVSAPPPPATWVKVPPLK